MTNDFTVTLDDHPDYVLISVAGEMDLDTCPLVDEATAPVPVGGKLVRLDLSGVSFMDSSGLDLLFRLLKRAEGEGGRLVLHGLQDQPRALFRLVGIQKVFDITARPMADTAGFGRTTPFA